MFVYGTVAVIKKCQSNSNKSGPSLKIHLLGGYGAPLCSPLLLSHIWAFRVPDSSSAQLVTNIYYSLPLTHTLPLTTSQTARLIRSSICSIRLNGLSDGCRQLHSSILQTIIPCDLLSILMFFCKGLSVHLTLYIQLLDVLPD